MAERVNFTKQALDKLLESSDGKRLVVHDNRQPGLIAELRPGGTLSFYLYRWANGRPHRLRIGAYPAVTPAQARDGAAKLLARLLAGEDPAELRRQKRQEPTLADLFAHWLDYAKQHKKTWLADETLFNRLLGGWKTRRLSSIKKNDVAALHARVGREHGLYMSNRLLALLCSMFNKAGDVGYDGPNPTKGVRKFREHSRDRFMQPDELPRFMAAVQSEPNDTLRDFFLLCLYTGARKSNVQAMAWEEINLAAATWRIPTTKSGDPVTVHLPKPAIEILARRVIAANGCPWVFPGGRKNRAGHLMDPKAAWTRLLTRAGIKDLRMHDLRRTLGSWQAAAGASMNIIGKSLGHRAGSSATAIYARMNLDPVRASVDTAVAALMAAGAKGGDDGKS